MEQTKEGALNSGELANEAGSIDGYGVLSEFIAKSLEPLGLQELLDVLLERLATLSWLHLDLRGAILLPNSGNQLVMLAKCGFEEEEDALCEPTEFDSRVCAQVMMAPKVTIMPYKSPAGGAPAKAEEDRHQIILPLVAEGRAIGTIPLFTTRQPQLTEVQYGFLDDLSRVLSGIVFRRLTEELVQLRELELEEARSDIINRLGTAAEYRDQETGMHVVRMKEYAGHIAKALGMPFEERTQLVIAAAMHDVGKIGIPDNILLKPGKLNDSEFETMKEHTRIGARILAGSDPIMRDAAEIALTHHEKWDGTGYPRGLKGDEIPLIGRICAVADVFDALTTERPYKTAWPVDKSVDLVEKMTDRDFDPDVVDAFVRVLPEIIRVRELFRDDVIDPHEVLDLPPGPSNEDQWFAWSDIVTIGLDVIDEHHHYLVDLTNELHTAVTEGHGSKAIGRTLRALERYTHVHFYEEERLMRQLGYRRYDQHHEQHQAFCDKIASFWEELKVSPLTLGHEAILYLREWLIHHVQEEDIHLRKIPHLAALQRTITLMALAHGQLQDREVDAMVEVYNKFSGSNLTRENMYRAIEDAKKSDQSVGDYLRDVVIDLPNKFKATMVQAAYAITAANGADGSSGSGVFSELTDALGMSHSQAEETGVIKSRLSR